ncbi:MAG: class I SAM-dependent methyltransferase [Chloroflexota bacterium]|nr:class I SAM-dependent methyltransferase [Chloroflexota bacterium]
MKPTYDQTRAAWETIWDGASMQVELDAIQSRRAQETLNRYRLFLPKDKPILEAGSGLSAVVITLRRFGYDLIGLDYAVNALHISRAYDPTLKLTAGDVHALPFADNALGGYLSFGVLEHFEHGMGNALKEAYRVLDRGGVLVLTIPYPNVVYRLVKWKNRNQPRAGYYETAYTRAELVRAVVTAGFHLAVAEPTSHDFTLWGLGGVFRAPGYYKTSRLAEMLGAVLRFMLPWAFNYMTLIVAHKPG